MKIFTFLCLLASGGAWAQTGLPYFEISGVREWSEERFEAGIRESQARSRMSAAERFKSAGQTINHHELALAGNPRAMFMHCSFSADEQAPRALRREGLGFCRIAAEMLPDEVSDMREAVQKILRDEEAKMTPRDLESVREVEKRTRMRMVDLRVQLLKRFSGTTAPAGE